MTEFMEAENTSPAAGQAGAPTATTPAGLNDLAGELLGIVQAVDGVHSVYPAQPLWQSIAGAAMAAVTGEALPLIALNGPGGPGGPGGPADMLTVKVRIGVEGSRPAPEVTREAAGAIRKYLHPRTAVVEISVVKLGS